MKKTVRIISIQRGGDDCEKMDLTVQGDLHRLRDTWILQYDEQLADDPVHTTLRLHQQSARIHRTGSWDTCLQIDQGQRSTCMYRTPYGECPLGVYGRTVTYQLTEDGGEIRLCYTLDLGGSNATEHEIHITVY